MNYTCEIIIDLPRDQVIELFDNPDNMKHWQTGFISLEPLSGTPGQAGAQSKLTYQMGKRTIEMTETILSRDLPSEFSATYEAANVWNEVKNFFHEHGPDQTRWVTEQTFRFGGFMKLMGWLMPGAFKKQSMKYLQDFKAFAESSER
ncbi:SRPBCC family protein [Pontibacter sp. G13]|uniref:SRPBCC family protein n=1 Tax=Pontibacter sp. G13 TaxID=3074898 RepID=UPI00288AE709|nr:SRPBCC family protein [Pontibacter sp. G13]WNJ18175.1 SRPBCC family protein [Pontibacter sp. G13]